MRLTAVSAISKSSKKMVYDDGWYKEASPGITISRLRLFCRRQMQQGLAV